VRGVTTAAAEVALANALGASAPSDGPVDVAARSVADLAGHQVVGYVSARRDVPPALLTLATALLFGLSFPPVGAAPLAWVALVPFLVALARVPPLRAAGLALLLAPAGALGVTWWFPSMVSAYFGTTALVGALAWLAFCTASVGLQLVPFAVWTSWMARRGAASPLLIAAAWGACEFLRARVWVGNPWGLMAYSQLSWLPAVQLADATGPYGPGMVLVGVNAVLAGLLAPALRGRHFRRSAAAALLLAGAALGYGFYRLGERRDEGDAVRVALVQPAVAAADRRTEAGRARAVARQLEATRQAVAGGSRLVVWPENAVDFYLEDPSPARDALLSALGDLDADVILGAPSYRHGEGGIRYRNSVYLVHRGTVAGRYDKMHLLPFAEETYEPGLHPYALRTRAGLLGPFVCFEAMYPELVRRIVVGGAPLLANLSNDAWFGAPAAAREHLDMARLRAVEERRWLLRATTTGISAIVDPTGRVVAATEHGTPALLEGVVRPSHTVTPYQRWGDLVAWCALALVVGAPLWIELRRLRNGGRP
jgi:apolipoprotein N-acyltransferase